MVQANWNGIMDSSPAFCFARNDIWLDGSPPPGGQRVGDGFVPASSRGWDLCGRMGTGMGPRMREDNGWGWILACVFAGGVRGWVPACARTTGRGWILACVFMGVGYGDGCELGRGMGPRIREDNGAGMRGWVPACARTTGGDGFLLCVFTGVGICAGGTGMGPRMREDKRRGWILACVFMGVGSPRGGTGMGPRMREDNGRGWK